MLGYFLRLLRKLFVTVFLAVMLSLGTLWLGLAFMAPRALNYFVDSITHFDCRSRFLFIDPISTKLRLSPVFIANSSDFQKKDFLDMRAFEITLGKPFLNNKKELLIKRVRIDIPTLTVVRNSKGAINTQVFLNRILSGGASDQTKVSFSLTLTQSAQAEAPCLFVIGECQISLDKVVLVDYLGHPEPLVREFPIHYELTMHDVRNVDFMTPLMNKLGSLDEVLRGALRGI